VNNAHSGPEGERLVDRVGPATAKGLAGLGLHTVADLLWHIPRRYYERGEVTSFEDLREGEDVTVVATVRSATSRRMQRRRGTITTVVVTDGHAELSLTFFSQPWRTKQLLPGRRVILSGTVQRYRGRLQLSHPECELLDVDEDGHDKAEARSGPVAVYPASAALPSVAVSKAVDVVLDDVSLLVDPIPAEVSATRGLLPKAAALRTLHRPTDRSTVEPALERLRFEEAFLLQAELLRRRAEASAAAATARDPRSSGLLAAFDAVMPWELTEGQRRVGEEIDADLSRRTPMQRLLQGDVGSGKTVVALRAMLRVVDAGGQAALLAPTEVLASQHARSIRDLLGPLGEAGMIGGDSNGTRVCLLTGSLGAAERRTRLLEIASGEAGIVVGTHALLYGAVTFADLGLVVVDEQHRFGVEQRSALSREQASGRRPHVLVMTATPIPRTVAMTVFGDLDVSVLEEVPPGRGEIVTHVVPAAEKPHYVRRMWERVAEEVAAGRRAYVVCPRIGQDGGSPEAGTSDAVPGNPDPDSPGEDPAAGMASVVDVYDELRTGPLQGLRLAVMHGALDPGAKDEAMRAFARGDVDVLVSTTVVEVGVDVPDATVMTILDADRFGVSQLHQLRGRVGRGRDPGVCFLVTDAPPGSEARQRLDAVAATRDGFALARLDLQQRREGDVLGATQSGRRNSLRVLSALRDEDVISEARVAAAAIVETDPTLSDHPQLREALEALAQAQSADYLEKT
jgi:ATP-dependent DNA helicase RecG